MTKDKTPTENESELPPGKKIPVTVVDKRVREDDDGEPGDAPDNVSPFPSVVAELELKLRQAQANFEAYKVQQQKEFDAFRERQAREASRQAELQAGKLLAPILDALDNLERAAQTAEPATADGLRLILQQILAGLSGAGCARIPADPGAPFDPAGMEALATQPAPTPGQSGTVATLYSGGWTLGDKILRTAKVVVYR